MKEKELSLESVLRSQQILAAIHTGNHAKMFKILRKEKNSSKFVFSIFENKWLLKSIQLLQKSYKNLEEVDANTLFSIWDLNNPKNKEKIIHSLQI